jgi:hypothetical protein
VPTDLNKLNNKRLRDVISGHVPEDRAPALAILVQRPLTPTDLRFLCQRDEGNLTKWVTLLYQTNPDTTHWETLALIATHHPRVGIAVAAANTLAKAQASGTINSRGMLTRCRGDVVCNSRYPDAQRVVASAMQAQGNVPTKYADAVSKALV